MKPFIAKLRILVAVATLASLSMIHAVENTQASSDISPIPHLSEAMGYRLGQQLQNENLPFLLKALSRGIQHGLSNTRPELTYPQIRRITADWKKRGTQSLQSPAGTAFGNPTEQLNYAIGFNVGSYLHPNVESLAADRIVEAVQSAIRSVSLGKGEMDAHRIALQTFFSRNPECRRSLTFDPAEINRKDGEAYMFTNSFNKEFVTSKYGYQYRIMAAGRDGQSDGTDPGTLVTYSSRILPLVNGQITSGGGHSTTANKARLVDVSITAVRNALSKMQIGAKWFLIVPPSLGFGEDGFDRVVGPNATFAVELNLIAREEPESLADLLRQLDSVLGPLPPSVKPPGLRRDFTAERDAEIRREEFAMDRMIANAKTAEEAVILKQNKETIRRTILEKWDTGQSQFDDRPSAVSPQAEPASKTERTTSPEESFAVPNPWNAKPSGIWTASVKRQGISQLLQITVQAQDDGGLVGYLVDTGAKMVGIPLSAVRYDGIRIFITVPTINAQFSGIFSRFPEKMMSGTWEERGDQMDIEWRPQESGISLKGFKFASEEARTNGTYGLWWVIKSGTWTATLPRGGKNSPIKLVLTGKGFPDLDGSITDVDARIKDIPIANAKFDAKNLSFEVPLWKATCNLTREPEDVFTGEWRCQGRTDPIVLEPLENKPGPSHVAPTGDGYRKYSEVAKQELEYLNSDKAGPSLKRRAR